VFLNKIWTGTIWTIECPILFDDDCVSKLILHIYVCKKP
jgi:hypothetical protein